MTENEAHKLLSDEEWTNKVHTAHFDCDRMNRDCISGSGNFRLLIEDARRARAELHAARERETRLLEVVGIGSDALRIAQDLFHIPQGDAGKDFECDCQYHIAARKFFSMRALLADSSDSEVKE